MAERSGCRVVGIFRIKQWIESEENRLFLLLVVERLDYDWGAKKSFSLIVADQRLVKRRDQINFTLNECPFCVVEH